MIPDSFVAIPFSLCYNRFIEKGMASPEFLHGRTSPISPSGDPKQDAARIDSSCWSPCAARPLRVQRAKKLPALRR